MPGNPVPGGASAGRDNGRMPDSSTPRPTQVTIAASLVMAGSVVVVLTAFDRIARLRSADTREAVQEFRATALGEWLGLDLQGTLSLMRVLTMVAAACATAAAILGFQILRRSRPARLVLTLLAPPLFLGGVAVGGFLPAVVVGSIIMLWFQPARDWLDGRTPRSAPASPMETPASPEAEAPPPLPPPPAPNEPRPYAGFGAATSAPAPPPPPTVVPPGVMPGGPTPYAAASAPPVGPARPAALMWACGLAWAGAAIVSVVMLLSVVAVLAAPDTLLDEVYRQNPDLRSEGITPSTLRSTVIVAGTLLVLWAVSAAVLAVFAWRGRSWAWTALLVSACCASGLCLIAAVTSPPMLVSLALCAPAIPLLLRPEVRAFVARRQP
jgi:hypothetical protein